MNYIKIYRFEDAPEELKMLSTNGGDEDWIVIIPPSLQDEYIQGIMATCSDILGKLNNYI